MRHRVVVFKFIYLFIVIFFIAGSVNAAEQIANPAAVYAGKLGYKYEIGKEGKGMVIFPDGTSCDEWDFFMGRDGQKWSYCQQHGGKIENRVDDMGMWTQEHAVCVFPDSSECDEIDNIYGKCRPAGQAASK